MHHEYLLQIVLLLLLLSHLLQLVELLLESCGLVESALVLPDQLLVYATQVLDLLLRIHISHVLAKALQENLVICGLRLHLRSRRTNLPLELSLDVILRLLFACRFFDAVLQVSDVAEDVGCAITSRVL
jgi:hypothetical protein